MPILDIQKQKSNYTALSKRLAKYVLLIQSIYEKNNLTASQAALLSGYSAELNKEFRIKDYPELKATFDKLQRQFVNDISTVILRGTSDEWKKSNVAQDALVADLLKEYKHIVGGNKEHDLYQTNSDALKAFQGRRDKGMNLSDKIWQQSEDYKRELEAAISTAIEKGTSAITLSKQVSKYLLNFKKLQKDYKAKFGKSADIKDCEYKSIRLARSEINMAYRNAEQERWKQIDFVLGYEVCLSKNHNCKGVPAGHFVDICDELAGRYPKNFKWSGWHVNCRCYAVPILMDQEQFVQWNNGEKTNEEEIKDLPKNFNKWAVRNADRISAAEKRNTLPYFVKDNKKAVKNLLPLTANKMAFESGRLYGFESISEFTQKSIANDIREIGNKLNIFPKNTNVYFSKNLENNTIMSWSNNALHISCGKYKMDDSAVFCPAIDLKNAFKKLKTKGDLTFNEEYAIEALFHESVHSKIKKQPTNVLESQILEICTQLYARNNYVRILRFYNKEPLNFNAIQINGYGYKDGCNLLRQYFTKDNQLQVGELINVANGTEDGVKKLLNKFKELNMSKQEQRKVFNKLDAMIKY